MRETDNLTPSDLQDDIRSGASAIDVMSNGCDSSEFNFCLFLLPSDNCYRSIPFPLCPILFYCASFIWKLSFS